MANVIDRLLDSNLDLIALDAFRYLGGRDLVHAQLTCKKWRDFIQRMVLHSASGRRDRLRRIDSNWRAGRCSKASFGTDYEVFDIKVDSEHIILGTMDGGVMLFDAYSMKEVLSEQVHEEGPVQCAFNQDFVVSVCEDKSIGLIDRRELEVLQTIKGDEDELDLGSHSDALWGVAVHGRRVCTGCEGGKIHVFNLAQDCSLQWSLQFERALSIHNSGITHLEMDSRYLLSGSGDKTLCVYDFQKNAVHAKLKTGHHVLCAALQWPLVVSCTCTYGLHHGVKVWRVDQIDGSESSSDTLQPIRQLTIQGCLDMRITDRFLVVAVKTRLNASLNGGKTEPSLEDLGNDGDLEPAVMAILNQPFNFEAFAGHQALQIVAPQVENIVHNAEDMLAAVIVQQANPANEIQDVAQAANGQVEDGGGGEEEAIGQAGDGQVEDGGDGAGEDEDEEAQMESDPENEDIDEDEDSNSDVNEEIDLDSDSSSDFTGFPDFHYSDPASMLIFGLSDLLDESVPDNDLPRAVVDAVYQENFCLAASQTKLVHTTRVDRKETVVVRDFWHC